MLASEVVAILNGYRERRKPISFDLEGNCNWVSCYSIADSPDKAVVVPFIRADGSSFWSEDGEVAIWEATERLLSDPDVPKILQNFLYDGFVLAWSYGILIRGLWVDTMLGHFELYCELEKSLGFQASIYTKEPFYKAERKSTDEMTQLIYCGKDACVTYECWLEIDKRLMPKQREHFQTNIQLLTPLLFMELRGIKFDETEAKRRLDATQKRIASLQDRINREAASGRPALAAFFVAISGVPGAGSEQSLATILATAFCVADPAEWRDVEEHFYEPQRWNGCKWCKAGKRLKADDHAAVEAALKAGSWQGNQAPSLQAADKGQTWLKPASKVVNQRCKVEVSTFADVRRFAKDSCRANCDKAIQLVKSAGAVHRITAAARGQLATLLNLSVKINATGQGGDAQWFLYDHCNLPKQFIKEGNRLTDRLASDDEAIIKAWVKCKDRRAIWFLNLRQLVTSTKSLSVEPDADGRIRCGYNLVGAETHRLTCYGSPTGSSDLNLQTVTKSHRALYKADDGCWLAQRDLSGADGFTCAAYMAMLGDTMMLEDYRAKLKPAQILVLMMDRGSAVNKMSRDELRPLCKPITEESDWRYFAMKRVQHAGSYMMWKNTMSDQILTDSFKKSGKPIYVPPSKCEEMLVKLLFVRYPGIPRLHAFMEREIKERGELRSSDGFVRRFYGRKDDKATVKAALAHLPQYYTTRATMMALMRLWSDPDNRRADGSLRIEPLHTVHDSLVTQFRKEDTKWAKVALDRCFQNPFLIAQTVLTIPASGTYGESWGQQDHQL